MKPTIVQKYGGTSVNSPSLRKNIIENAKQVLSSGKVPVIVVSAMGRFPDPYSTDKLLSLAGKNASKRNLDFISICGEMISASVVASEFEAEGVKAMALTGFQAGIVTDNNYTDASILKIDTAKIDNLVMNDIVPVICGFQGITDDLELTTLGRGGSDTAAAAVGYYLKSESVEIYTDVDGIYATDPRIVADAGLFRTINYDDCLEMAELGAKVIHPKAVRYAKMGNIDMYVLNTAKPRLEVSTRICNDTTDLEGSDNFVAIASAHNGDNDQINIISDKKGMLELVVSALNSMEELPSVNVRAEGRQMSVEVPVEKTKETIQAVYKAVLN